MVVNKCVEQGVYVILMLTLQKDHKPLKSTELSSILGVSDSYLKKILRKMVLAGLIISSPGKEGGFTLARSVEEITVYDVYAALEGETCDLRMTGIGENIFRFGKDFTESESKVLSALEHANEAFGNELRKLYLSELVTEEHYAEGTVDFRALMNKKRNH